MKRLLVTDRCVEIVKRALVERKVARVEASESYRQAQLARVKAGDLGAMLP